MASNNRQKTFQQRRWTPKSGGAAASKSPKSQIVMDGEKLQMLESLKDMFRDVIDLEVIHSVAESCNYNTQAAAEALMMISNDVDIRKNPEYSASYSVSSHGRKIHVPELPMQAPVKTKNVLSRKIDVPELPMQAKARKEKDLLKYAAFLTQNMSSKSNRAPSPGLGPIKVAYRSPDNCEESDSDADVVIEEEKEYEMSAGNAAFSLVNIPYQFPPHFVTPMVQMQEHSQNKLTTKAKTSRPSMKAAMTKLPTIKPPTNVSTTAIDSLNRGTLSSAQLLQRKPVKVLTVAERVQKNIEEGTRVMILMRGVPGSGKTFLAKHIIELTMGKKADHSKYIFSTDDFFVILGRFIPEMLPEAHNWNKNRVRAAVEQKFSPVFVDNTNTEVWEMQPYALLAVKHGYILELLEPSTPWRYQESKLVQKNVHRVPKHQIHNMLARFEKNLTGQKLLALLRLKYSSANKPPQPAANSPSKPRAKIKTKQPQREAAAIGAVAPATPISIKPKRTRIRRRHRKLTESDQLLKQKCDVTQVDEAKKMMDTLAQFLAEKFVDKNRNLDSSGASSQLKSGTTAVKDMVLSNLENIPEIRALSAETQSMLYMWRNKELGVPEGSTVSIDSSVENQNSNFVTEGEREEKDLDDDGSNEDGSEEDTDEEEEEEEDEEEGDETDSSLPKMPEWTVSDEEWEYQSDRSEESDVKINKQDKFPERPEECLEYILITDNSTWVYQRDHSEEKQDNSDLLIDLSNEIVSDVIPQDNQSQNTSSIDNNASKFETNFVAHAVDSKQLEVLDNIPSTEIRLSVQETGELLSNIEIDTVNTDTLKNTLEADISKQAKPVESSSQFSVTDFLNEFISHKTNNSQQDILIETGHQSIVANTIEVFPEVGATILNDAYLLQSEKEIGPHTISPDELNQWLCELEPSLIDTHEAGSEHEQEVSRNVTLCTMNSEVDIKECATQIQNIPIMPCSTAESSNIDTTDFPQKMRCDLDNDIKISSTEVKKPDDEIGQFTELPEISSDIQKTEAIAEKSESKSPILEVPVHENSCLDSAQFQEETKSDLLKPEPPAPITINESDKSPDGTTNTESVVIKSEQTSSSELIQETTNNSVSVLFEQHDSKFYESLDDKQTEKNTSCSVSASKRAREEWAKFEDISVSQLEELQKHEYSSLFRLDSTSSGTSILNEIAQLQKIEDMPVLQPENETTSSMSEPNVATETDKPGNVPLLQLDDEVTDSKDTLLSQLNSEVFISSMTLNIATESDNHSDISLIQQSIETPITNKVSSELQISYNKPLESEVEACSTLLNITESQDKDSDVTHQQATDEDDFHSAVSSDTSGGKGEKRQKMEGVPMMKSTEPLPTYDLLSWVMKCNEDENAVDEWEKRSAKEAEKSENLLGPRPAREQKSLRKSLRPIRQIAEKKEIEVYVPPECANWATVAEPTVTWENSVTKTENVIEDTSKKWDGPQPQRLLFSSAEIIPPAKLLTPNDFIHSKDPQAEDICELSSENGLEPKVDNSSNTNYQDFALLSKLNKNGDTAESVEGVKVLHARSLCINDDTVSFKSMNQHFPCKLMIDRSSMTNEDDDVAMALLVSAREVDAVKTQDLEQLVTMFPDVSRDGLMEIFEKCNFDLNWTVDLLLDSKLEQFEPVSTTTIQNEAVNLEDSQKTEEETPCEEINTTREEEIDETTKKLWQQEVKRYIEESFVLGDENYSEHTLRIKKLRHGEMMDMGEVTTKPTQSFPDNDQNVLENTLGAIGSEQSEERAQAADEETESTSSSNFEEEEMIPARLDIGLINQLHEMFGFPVLVHPEDTPSAVNLPVSLARQLHSYIVESQFQVAEQQRNQMEQMLEEDKELARRLQEQEHSANNKVPDLQEIMDMEMALELCRSYKNEEKISEEDLATKMKKQKLFEMFPNLDHEALLSLFISNDNNFDKTVDAVIACMGEDGESVKNVWAPEAFERLKEAVGHRKEENTPIKTEQGTAVHRSLPLIVVHDPPELDKGSLYPEEAMNAAEFYRKQSIKFRQQHNELVQKCREANNKRKYGVALWYSNMAHHYLSAIDKANTKAAAMILRANELRHDQTTLDLHFLHVTEALHTLDVFLDFHIALLSPAVFKKSLFLITGRGRHSKDGKSRIRPAVENRLAQRNIKWRAENPGLLRVVIKSTTSMSCAIRKVS